MLVNAGAEINPAARPLGAPLHLASYLGLLGIGERLLDQGADINAAGGHFGSALIASMCNDQNTSLNVLLARGIDVNVRSEKFGTVLHFACRYHDGKAMEVLLQNGADVNAKGAELQSPLAILISRISNGLYLDAQNMLRILLLDDRLEVREADISRVLLRQVQFEDNLMKDLLMRAQTAQVTRQVIVAALSSPFCPVGILNMISGRAEGLEIDSGILKSVKMPWHLKALLEAYPGCVITTDVFKGWQSDGGLAGR